MPKALPTEPPEVWSLLLMPEPRALFPIPIETVETDAAEGHVFAASWVFMLVNCILFKNTSFVLYCSPVTLGLGYESMKPETEGNLSDKQIFFRIITLPLQLYPIALE